MAQLQYGFCKRDEYFTPSYAVYPIMKRLKPGATVWCPFDKEDSEFVRVLSKHGFQVVYGHIHTGQDFFQVAVPECDYIVSNPPYSLKNEVIKRLYEIGKPFAMLINFQGIFDSRERFQMFQERQVEMLWLNPRVNYITEDKNHFTECHFKAAICAVGYAKASWNLSILIEAVEGNCTFAPMAAGRYNGDKAVGGEKKLLDDFRFETFVDAQSTAFQEYLSAVVAKLAKEDEAYRAIWDRIEKIYEQYPRVMGVCDREAASALTEQECQAVIEIASLRNQRIEIELEAVYFRGCYDSVGYLKKAGIL